MGSECIDFRYEFNKKSKNVNKEKVQLIKSTCKKFLIEFCHQLQKRIPKNIDMLERISGFTPRQSIHDLKRDITDIVIYFKDIVGDLDTSMREWHCLNLKTFAEKDQSTEEYWMNIDKMTTAGGEKRYRHIS